MNRTQPTSTVLVLMAALVASTFMPRTALAQSNPFIGQLMLVGYTFCPRDWTEAEGQLLPISQYSALFSLYGTTFGGDGWTTFGLPDLRGRVPISLGQGPGLQDYRLGSKAGSETFALTNPQQMPMHSHDVIATNQFADKPGPGGKLLAADNVAYRSQPYPQENVRVMDPTMISQEGSSQPVNHRGPYLTMRWCVALTGLFPSRN